MIKGAIFSDIHFGRKNNSEEHNQDCIDYINWFAENVKKDREIDHVIFMGDWHESRNAISGLTLNYSIEGATILNDLKLPVYFIVGNHDLFYRKERKIYTPVIFRGFDNFKLISQITKFPELKNVLFVPYLFENEYPDLIKNTQGISTIFSHLEFKDFIMTGEFNKSENGIDMKNIKHVDNIFCGHFHKRQSKGNIHYIGNTFQMDFSDTNDFNKGMCTFEYKNSEIKYIDYPNGPKYIKCKVSDLLENHKNILHPKSYVVAFDDIKLDYEATFEMIESFTKKYSLRNFHIEQMQSDAVEENIEVSEQEDIDTSIKNALENNIKADDIDNARLVKIYNEIRL
jgi:DNA repair exonuclease SbcCD nuclease subunit